MTRLRSLLPDVVDLHIYGGIAALSGGVWWIWRPGGLMVLGAALLGLGLFHLLRR